MPPAMSSMPMSPDLESARMAAPQSYGPPRLKRTNTWLFVIMMLLFGVALGLLILFFLMP